MIEYKRVVKLIIVEEILVGVIWEKYDKNCSNLFYKKIIIEVYWYIVANIIYFIKYIGVLLNYYCL